MGLLNRFGHWFSATAARARRHGDATAAHPTTMADALRGDLDERVDVARQFHAALAETTVTRLIEELDARLVRERLFREDFTHAIKTELLGRIDRLEAAAATPPSVDHGGEAAPPGTFSYDFAILNVSFRRDLERSLNCYRSFEVHFIEKDTPFFIVVPDADVDLFQARFAEAADAGVLRSMPRFVTKEALLAETGEPCEMAMAMGGYYAQQVIKLCFGLSRIARHYLVIDSDTFLIRDLSKSQFYGEDGLKHAIHEVWHSGLTVDAFDARTGVGHGDPRLQRWGVRLSDSVRMIRCILGVSTNRVRNYIVSATVLDATVVSGLKARLKHGGVPSFAFAIHLAAFEFQWYGEFLHATSTVDFMPYILHMVIPP